MPSGLNAGSAYVDILPNTEGFARDLGNQINRDLGTASRDATRTMEQNLRSAGAKLTKVGAGLSLGITAPLVAFGKQAQEAGAQAIAFDRKAATVFGNQITTVKRWADANNEAFGLTEAQLAGLAAGFGDLLIPMGFTRQVATQMTTDVLGLAGALSEWSGGARTVAEVSDILTSAMLGERDALKGLGISISAAEVETRLLEKGQQDLTGQLKQQAEAVATQELLFEKSTDAQEAYAAGGDEAARAANKLKAEAAEMSEEFGRQLVPAMAKAQEVGAELIGRFNDMGPAGQKMTLALAGALAVAGPLTTAIGGLVSGAGLAVTGVKKMTAGVQTLRLQMALGRAEGLSYAQIVARSLNPATLGVTAALGAGAFALKVWTDRKREAKEATDAYVAALKEDSGAIGDNTRAAALNRLEKAGIVDDAQKLGVFIPDLVDAILGEEDAYKRVTDQIARYNDADAAGVTHDQWEAAVDLEKALREESTAVDLATSAQARLNPELLKFTELGGAAERAAMNFGRETETVGGKVDDARVDTLKFSDALDLLSQKMDRFEGKAFNVKDATSAYEQAVDGLRESVKGATDSLDDNSTSLDLSTSRGRDNHAALTDLVSAANDRTQAVFDETKSVEDANAVAKEQREELRRVAERLGLSEEKAKEYAGAIRDVPKKWETKIQVVGAEAAKRALDDLKAKLGGLGDTVQEISGQMSFKVDGSLGGRITYNTGGQVPGGYGTRDEVRALLTRGEYVASAPAVRHYGPQLFEALNRRQVPQSVAREILRGTGDGPGSQITAAAQAAVTHFEKLVRLPTGAGWQAMWAFLQRTIPGVELFSGLRPGAITATGKPSYHGMGRAVDITPSMAVFNAIAASHPDSAELIYSPAGNNQIWKGQKHFYGEPTRGDHWDHVHWALNKGGLVGRAAGRRIADKVQPFWRGGLVSPARVTSPKRRARIVDNLIDDAVAAGDIAAINEASRAVEQLIRQWERADAAAAAAADRQDLVDAVGKAETALSKASAKERKAAEDALEEASEALREFDKEQRRIEADAKIARDQRRADNALEDAERAAARQQERHDNRQEWAFEHASAQQQLAWLDEKIDKERKWSDAWVDLAAQREDLAQRIADEESRAADEAARAVAETAAASKRAFDDALTHLNQLLDEHDRIQAALKDGQRQFHDQLAEAASRFTAEQQQVLADRHSQLQASLRLDQRFIVGWGNSVASLLSNTRSQNTLIAEWSASLQTLRDRGLSEELVAALGLDTSPESLAQVRRFTQATDEQMAELNTLLADRARIIGQQVAAEQQGLYGDVGRRLVELQARHSEEVGRLQQAFLDQQEALKQQLASLGEEQGRTYLETMQEALATNLPPVLAELDKLKAAFEAVQAVAAASPSQSLVDDIIGSGARNWAQVTGAPSLRVFIGTREIHDEIHTVVDDNIQSRAVGAQIAGVR